MPSAPPPLSLPPGFYRLIARLGQHTSEVYRTVPTVVGPAGRLLRLTATSGLEKDPVFHVVNDVS